MTQVPIVCTNNNCATGSTALYLARQMVAGGLCDCTMALGFEMMEKGSLTSKFRCVAGGGGGVFGVGCSVGGGVCDRSPPLAMLVGKAGRQARVDYFSTSRLLSAAVSPTRWTST